MLLVVKLGYVDYQLLLRWGWGFVPSSKKSSVFPSTIDETMLIQFSNVIINYSNRWHAHLLLALQRACVCVRECDIMS
jgi:hypothetical protein